MRHASSDQERHAASMVSPNRTGRTRHGTMAEDVDAFSSHCGRKATPQRRRKFSLTRPDSASREYKRMSIESLSIVDHFANLAARAQCLSFCRTFFRARSYERHKKQSAIPLRFV
jgi:hypothetical protein